MKIKHEKTWKLERENGTLNGYRERVRDEV